MQVRATKNLFWERRLHVSHAIQAKMAIHFQCYWRPQVWQIDKRDSNLTSQPTGNCYCFWNQGPALRAGTDLFQNCQISPSQAPLTGHFAYTSPRQCATINNETSWVALLGLLTERLSSMQRSTWQAQITIKQGGILHFWQTKKLGDYPHSKPNFPWIIEWKCSAIRRWTEIQVRGEGSPHLYAGRFCRSDRIHIC